MRQATGAAVKRQVGADPLERGERHQQDLYRTGPAGTRALLAVERFPGVVWEPACGQGDMVTVLHGLGGRAAGIDCVFASDLYDHPWHGPVLDDFPLSLKRRVGVDFLRDDPPWPPSTIHHVVTNPPFRVPGEQDSVAAFAFRARGLVSGKVALLGRLAWLEGTTRKRKVFDVFPPSRVWVFPFRCPMARGNLSMRSGLVAFAWYVWDPAHAGKPELGWLPENF